MRINDYLTSFYMLSDSNNEFRTRTSKKTRFDRIFFKHLRTHDDVDLISLFTFSVYNVEFLCNKQSPNITLFYSEINVRSSTSPDTSHS